MAPPVGIPFPSFHDPGRQRCRGLRSRDTSSGASTSRTPHDAAGIRVRATCAPYALVVAPGIADEYQSVPSNGGRRNGLASSRIRDDRGPEEFAVLGGIGDHMAIGRAAKHAPLQVGRAPVDLESPGGKIAMGTPIQFAGVGVDRNRVVLGSGKQRAFNLDQARLKRHLFAGIEAAAYLEPRDAFRINGIEGGESLGSERVVVARPVLVCRLDPPRAADRECRGDYWKSPLHRRSGSVSQPAVFTAPPWTSRIIRPSGTSWVHVAPRQRQRQTSGGALSRQYLVNADVP